MTVLSCGIKYRR